MRAAIQIHQYMSINRNADDITSHQSTASIPSLPPEIWHQIIGNLKSNSHLKAVSLVGRLLLEFGRNELWREPRFTRKLPLRDLEEVAGFSPPIQTLKLSDIYLFGTDIIDAVVLLRDSFQLSAFKMDQAWGGVYSIFSIDEVQDFLSQLPVTQLNAQVFNTDGRSGGDYVDDWMEFLREVDDENACPPLTILRDFHRQLKIEDFQQLCALPIHTIEARFEHSIDLQEYDWLMAQVRPPPVEFCLDGNTREQYPGETLWQMKQTRITRISSSYLSKLNCQELTQALCDNNQFPVLKIKEMAALLTPSDLLSLSRYPIVSLNSSCLAMNPQNAHQFVDALVKCNIDKLLVADYHTELFDGEVALRLKNSDTTARKILY